MITQLKEEAVELLKGLIQIPSFSKEEDKTADLIQSTFEKRNIKFERKKNNVWVTNKHFDPKKKSILLNSHHDTVKPNDKYTNPPFEAAERGGILYGLGSNDAGGALVSLWATFLRFYEEEDLKYNLVFAATAEEEISGKNGIASILKSLPAIDFGIVGEPTEMKMAVTEKGLVVLDCKVLGEAGHAARKNGKNAIEMALEDLNWLKDYEFQKESSSLGKINMSVTQIKAGTQHNVIPSECDFVVDVRTTDAYTNEEVVEIISSNINAEVTPRSTRLQPSGVDDNHVLVQAAKALKIDTYGSPTLSDQALMAFSTIKMGPGKSERSHTADEYIWLQEIYAGIDTYVKLLELINEKS